LPRGCGIARKFGQRRQHRLSAQVDDAYGLRYRADERAFDASEDEVYTVATFDKGSGQVDHHPFSAATTAERTDEDG